MKIENINYESIDELRQKLDLRFIDTNKTLIQVFSGCIEKNEILDICKILKDKNSDIKFIGTTTAGEIYNGNIGKGSITISIMEFEHTSFINKHFNNEDNFELGVDIANSLFVDNTKVMILFIEGLLNNGNDVVDGIASVDNTIPIAGGMAGDNGAFSKTYIFDNNGVYENGAVAVSLNSKVLNVLTNYQLNWQAIGKFMTITKAKKNRLYEIDGIPASDIYRRYLGDKIGDDLPHSAIEFPLLKIEENGLEICRTFVHKFDEDGSLLTIGNLDVGDKVRLAFGNVDLIINGANEDIRNYQYFQPEAIFTYSCASRITFLQSDVVRELQPLNDIAPIAGFFTYGEIYHQNNKNSLLNISLTILGLSESSSHKKISIEKSVTKEEKNFTTGKHFMVLDALSHLINRVISELNESKLEIEEINKHTRESIEYASLIQSALIPDNALFKNNFQDNFTIWQPKDIVGGDIYLFEELRDKDECLLMVIDCTGHGVPGAFVTMLVKAIERQIVAKINSDLTIDVSPAWILSYFNRTMKTLLKQESKDSISNAGFDGGIIYYNKKDKILKYAGAETALFYVENDELKTMKGNRYSVGYKKCAMDYEYKEHTVEVKERMQFYLTTDGYLDQNGGDKSFPFGKKRFQNIITENHQQSFDKQKEVFIDTLKTYQGNEERNDDVTLVGFRI
jgi:serine phosphatase RsbU (regulator of sigma subunit)